jgi:CRISPR-associated protein Csd1
MTILQSLARRYDRQAAAGNASIPGYAPAQISFTFVLALTGQVVTVNDERSGDKRKRPRSVEAPQAPNDRRGKRIVAGSFWDPADYALGVPRPDILQTETSAKKLHRKAVEKFAAFKRRHQEILAGSDDEGCVAMLLGMVDAGQAE